MHDDDDLAAATADLAVMLLRAVHASWDTLWTTRIGATPLRVMHVDAQTVGKLFQEVLTAELHAADPRAWRDPRAPRSPKDKDCVCLTDPGRSFELKMCGQPGGRRVHGNRCSAAGYASQAPGAKDRDTWLLTVNYSFVDDDDPRLNLVRFGWVRGADWVGQRAASGNAARLRPEAYATQLRVVRGPYQRGADPRVLARGGRALARAGVRTVGEAADAGDPEARRFLDADFYV